MNEQAGPPVLGGTILVVLGVALITWQPDTKAMDYLVARFLFSWSGNSRQRCFSAPPLRFDDYQRARVFCRDCRGRVAGVLTAVCLDIASQSKYRLAPKSSDAFLGVWVLRGLGRAVEPDGSRCRYRGRDFADRCNHAALEFA